MELRRWAFARFDLGLSEAEYAQLPEERFAALSERWLERQRREDFRAGQITATLANLLSDRTKHKEAFKPEDFFPLLLDSRFRGNDRVGGNDGDGQGRNAAKAGMTAEQMFDAAKLHHQTIIRSRK